MPRHKVIREKKDIKKEITFKLKRKPRKTKGSIIQTRKECAMRALEVVQLLKNVMKDNINKIRLERMEFESLLEMIKDSTTPLISSNERNLLTKPCVLDSLKSENEASSTINFSQFNELNAFCSSANVPKDNLVPSEPSVAASLSSLPCSTSLSGSLVQNSVKNH